jgi:N-acetylneuraminic acid mutarotase
MGLRLFVLFVLCTSLHGQTWQQLSDFPGAPRDDGTAVTIGATSYFGLGLNNGFALMDDWWAYHHPTDTWTALESFPGPPMQYTASVGWGSDIYLIGGLRADGPSAAYFVFDSSSKTWEAARSLPMGPRSAGLALRYGDQIIFGMGHDGQTCHNDLWIFNPQNDQWRFMTTFPGQPRQQMKAFVTNHLLLIGSGRCGGACFFDWYQYDLTTGRWSLYDAPTTPDFCSYQFQLEQPEVYMVGGGMIFLDSFDIQGFSNQWFWYHKAERQWSQLPDLPGVVRRSGGSMYWNNQWLLISGLNGNGLRDAEVWRIDLPFHSSETKPLVYMSMDELVVRNPNAAPFSVLISDIMGREVFVWHQPEATSETRATIGKLSKGVYVIRVTVNGKTHVYKEVIP